ncbi:MAG: protease pro-enzyme activation domain-containing protein, partial [Terriglobales bacterium]
MTNQFNECKAFLFLLILATFLNALTAFAQAPRARITELIDNSAVVRVAGTHHPLASAENDRGRVHGATAMDRMVLVLKPGDDQAAALTRLIDGQHDRQSPTYRNWLTPEQYGTQFGPAQQDLDKITAWLQQQGFRVDAVARGRQWIEFSGTAGQVESAFHTEMHHYLVNGEDHVANAGDISLPRGLAPVVSGVLSLHNFRKHAAHAKAFQLHRNATTGEMSRVAELVPSAKGITAASAPEFTGGSSNHYLTPGDYARIYNTAPLLKEGVDGSNVSIAVVGRTDINLSDVQAFRQIFGLPVKDPTFIVNGLDPGINGDELESALDVEWSGAAAPNASIKFVTTESTFTTDGIDLSTSYIVDNLVAPIMSSSYGQCEAFLGITGNTFFNSIYQQAAAEGITVFVSSGDDGPAACDYPVSYTPAQNGLNVSGLASTPYNVAVGGTQFRENGADSTYWLANNRADLSSAIGYIPEGVWNESCDPTVDPTQCGGSGLYQFWSGSGGASSCTQSTVSGNQITCISGYPKPSWQTGRGVPGDGARDLPDLALTAAGGHDGYLVCVEGSCQWTVQNGNTILNSAAVVGGTSASTPSMAGIMALVEQKNGTFQGLANYSLYQLAAAEKIWPCDSSRLTDPRISSTCVFYDVNAGNSNIPGQPGFKAGTGYDKATGLGSVNAANLANAWSSARKLASATTLSARTKTVQHGIPLPLTVGVQPLTGSGAPTGDFSLVSDTHGGVFAGSLASGSFSGGVNGLEGGTYSIKAHYAGDAMFSSSDSSPVGITVTPEPSAVTAAGWEINLAGIVVPLFGPVNYGQPVALQFNVQGKSGIGSPTGQATILLDDSVKLGTFPLNQGGSGWVQVDNLTRTGLVVGQHSFKILY